MLKATYDLNDIELYAVKNDLRLLPLKHSAYMELIALVKKTHGPLCNEQRGKQPKFNWNEGKTSYTFFDTFELEWLKIIGQHLQRLTPQKYYILMQLVVEALCIVKDNEF